MVARWVVRLMKVLSCTARTSLHPISLMRPMVAARWGVRMASGARRLRSAVPARYLLEQCLPTARGLSGRAATAAAAQRAQGFRRMCEPGALVALTRALAEHGALQG